MTTPRLSRNISAAASSGSALMAALALIGLVVIGAAPGSAQLTLRADAYDQMTGIGLTASAVTVSWTSGLLDSSNQPITGSSSTDGGPELNPNSDRAAGTGSLSFMDSDFAKLSVTVSQTENITQQGITVQWANAPASTPGNPYGDFMQMMECYGDSASGPNPENCEYGSPGMLGTSLPNQQITTRVSSLCAAGAVSSTGSPPPTLNGQGPAQGCDPNEPTSETTTTSPTGPTAGPTAGTFGHCDPTTGSPETCAAGDSSIPFVPADDQANPLYGAGASGTGTGTLFNQFNTNEVQAAYTTGQGGSGTHQFETLTATQAPGLGCGEAESSGQTRNCWLVIVPRGNYAPNGFKASPSVPLLSSPLSASNWAQRIQIHLGYAPLAANCPPTVLPDAMVGTQVAYRAVTSWQSALNQAAKCSTVYSYTATTETAATSQLQSPGGGNAGLAFTTIPIGSEAGGSALSGILYAPVAVTATDFGFNINQVSTGQVTKPVNLTPSLLARVLTQVYKPDLPDADPGPAWVQGNPASWTADPDFQKLNNPDGKGITNIAGGIQDFPLITGDHSAANQQIWQWIQSDPATASWLDGGTDPNNKVTADPDYVKLNLGQSPAADNFDEAYTGTLTCAQAVGLTATSLPTVDNCNGPLDPNPVAPNTLQPQSCVVPQGDTANPASKACDVLNSEDLLPVENNYDQAAAAVLSAVDPSNTRQWIGSNKGPDGTDGWWGTVGTELPGHTFMWAVNDMPDLAAYGLISAALCLPAATAATATAATNPACTQPSTASVTAALNSATPDSAGLLQVNPATVPSDGYPLTQVVYAAVPTNQSASTLTDYANFISYAAGQGQTAGTAPGDLPPGYLPLPASLQTQAQSVVTHLRALAAATPTPTPTPTPTTSAAQQQTTTAGNTTTGGSTTTGDTTTGDTTTGDTTTGGSTTTTGGSSTTTTAGSTTTGGGTTTGAGTTSAAGTTAGSHPPTTPAAKSAATSTCTPAAAPSPSASPSLSGSPSPAPGSTACAAPQAFNVLPASAQAAAGTTPLTSVGGIRVVLIIVLIIGAVGALAGALLRYGQLPGRGRPRRRTGSP